MHPTLKLRRTAQGNCTPRSVQEYTLTGKEWTLFKHYKRQINEPYFLHGIVRELALSCSRMHRGATVPVRRISTTPINLQMEYEHFSFNGAPQSDLTKYTMMDALKHCNMYYVTPPELQSANAVISSSGKVRLANFEHSTIQSLHLPSLIENGMRYLRVDPNEWNLVSKDPYEVESNDHAARRQFQQIIRQNQLYTQECDPKRRKQLEQIRHLHILTFLRGARSESFTSEFVHFTLHFWNRFIWLCMLYPDISVTSQHSSLQVNPMTEWFIACMFVAHCVLCERSESESELVILRRFGKLMYGPIVFRTIQEMEQQKRARFASSVSEDQYPSNDKDALFTQRIQYCLFQLFTRCLSGVFPQSRYVEVNWEQYSKCSTHATQYRDHSLYERWLHVPVTKEELQILLLLHTEKMSTVLSFWKVMEDDKHFHRSAEEYERTFHKIVAAYAARYKCPLSDRAPTMQPYKEVVNTVFAWDSFRTYLRTRNKSQLWASNQKPASSVSSNIRPQSDSSSRANIPVPRRPLSSPLRVQSTAPQKDDSSHSSRKRTASPSRPLSSSLQAPRPPQPRPISPSSQPRPLSSSSSSSSSSQPRPRLVHLFD